MRGRLWQIDAVRGIAVIAMLAYHFSYDLAFFGLFDVRFFRSGAGLDAGRAIGGTFIFLAGLSLALSYHRAISLGSSGWGLSGKYLWRGVKIFSYGMAITFVTWIFVPEGTVLFGVLHLIGASIILAYPFLNLKLPNAALGALCIALGLYLRDLGPAEPWLLWLGTRPHLFMLDYWPIFPWFGVVLLGVFAGNVLYPWTKRIASTAPGPPLVRPLAFLGRHSLPIYLIHQPVLIASLILLGVGDTGVLF